MLSLCPVDLTRFIGEKCVLLLNSYKRGIMYQFFFSIQHTRPHVRIFRVFSAGTRFQTNHFESQNRLRFVVLFDMLVSSQ